MKTTLVLISSLGCLFTFINASAIKFEASPSVLKQNLTTFASMRCSLADTEHGSQIGRRDVTVTNTTDDVWHINTIIVRRDGGQEVTFITPFDPPTAMVDQGNLHVKGEVTGRDSTGYVELSWSDASRVPLGGYECEVQAVDQQHHQRVYSSSLELTSEPPSVSDVIVELKKQQQEILSLNNKVSIQASTITQLTQCTSMKVSFMAVISKFPSTFGMEKLVVFDKAISNEGNAYNSQTGKFFCSVPGNYFFSTNIVSYGTIDSCLHLKVNSQTVTSLRGYEDHLMGSGSTSAMIHLDAGDEVHVQTARCLQARFFQDTNVFQANVFTGHLVYADKCLIH